MLAVLMVALHVARLVTGRCRRSQHRPFAAANVRLTLHYPCNVQHSELGLNSHTVAVWLSFGPIESRISAFLRMSFLTSPAANAFHQPAMTWQPLLHRSAAVAHLLAFRNSQL